MEEARVRTGWLKFMYVCTLVAAGSGGIAVLVAPGAVRDMMGLPGQGRLLLGMAGSVFVGFALLSILGLRSPLKFAPVLLLQFCYKVLWLVAVVLPLAIAGRLPQYAILPAVVYIAFVIGDLIAIPFSRLLAREQ